VLPGLAVGAIAGLHEDQNGPARAVLRERHALALPARAWVSLALDTSGTSAFLLDVAI
jgi:hypothetical protein